MKSKVVLKIMLTLLVISTLTLALNVAPIIANIGADELPSDYQMMPKVDEVGSSSSLDFPNSYSDGPNQDDLVFTAQSGENEEPEVVMVDLEGPDSIPPPDHYKTLEMILADTGLASSASGSTAVPVSGTREILVILAELSDMVPYSTSTVAYFDDRFFDTTAPSVRDFYDEVSYSAFTYVPGAVLGWYPSTKTQASYLADHYAVFVEAIGDVDPFFDFGPYDADNNGLVENDELTLFMIVSGDLGGALHTWNKPNVATADTNALGNPVSVEGEYSRTHEDRHIGSYCHELGHDLGLPDLYDDSHYPYDSYGIGNYGLMGGGSWTFSHPTAWSKIQLGWIIPTVVTADGYYDVHDAETNAEAYVLVDPAHPYEYFLIENRYPSNSYYETEGGPSGNFTDEGIVIYHIDDTKLTYWIRYGTNEVNADEAHKGVDVECADFPTSHVINADDLDALVNGGDSGDLWDIGEYDFSDTSTPCNANWYSSAPSGMEVSEFPAATPTMRVYISVPPASWCDILIVNDDDGGDNVGTGTSLPQFESALTDGGYSTRYMVWTESSMGTPPLHFLRMFKLVIWTCGTYYNWAVDPLDAEILEDYVAQGGNLLLEGEHIGFNHKSDEFMVNVAHANVGHYQAVVEGLTVTDSTHPVTDGLPTSFAWGTTPPLRDEISPTNGGAEVIRYTGTGTGRTAVTVFDGVSGGSVVYYAFPLYCLDSTKQETLAINSVNWLLEPQNQLPVADANGPYSGTEGVAISFDGSASYDTDGTIVSWLWDFGDGQTSTEQNPTHTYTQDGTYTVTLTVTDDNLETDDDTTTADISDSDPVADFVASPTSGVEPLTVTFTDQSISWDEIDSWLWDFGDGQTSTEQNPTHEYTEGTYTVSLTIQEADTDSDSEIKTDHINVLAPIPEEFDLTLAVSGSGSTSPAVGVHSYADVTPVDVTASASAGWTFDHWMLDAVDVGSANPITVTMDADHSLTAVFEEIPPELFDLTLNPGWNMVSFPCLPDAASFSSIFSDVGFYQVLTWDGSSYVTPPEAEAGVGYWVLVLEETTITIDDADPVTSYTTTLPAGWSMIGSIYEETVNATDVFPGFYQLLTWNGSSYVTATTIEPGKGYWALVLEQTTITVGE